jgi:hypothetical protein
MKIAMKCNQEQFNAVKDKLNGTYSMIGRFENHPYLITNYYEGEKHISNTQHPIRLEGHKVYETWNEQIFLDACGIETEKIFKAGELQFMAGDKWCNTVGEYRLKPNNTAEIEALEKQKLEIDKQINKLR